MTRPPEDTQALAERALDDLAQTECTCAHHPYAACGYCGAVNRVREYLAVLVARLNGWLFHFEEFASAEEARAEIVRLAESESELDAALREAREALRQAHDVLAHVLREGEQGKQSRRRLKDLRDSLAASVPAAAPTEEGT